ncbi:MAG: hypothetical protein ACREQI_03450 [Candidatus Binataceae bacterium]
MNGNGQKINTGTLRNLYQTNPAARAMLDEFAGRKSNRTETKVDNLLYLKVEDRPITRGEIIQTFQQLDLMGCGTFVVGRKGHSSRFQWTVGLPSVGKAASGETVSLEALSEEERKEAAALPEEELETYLFPLRPNLKVELELPTDLSSVEASRLADFIKALPFDRKPADQV